MTISPGGAEVAVIITLAAVISLALTGLVGWLVYRAAQEAQERRTGLVRALPEYRVPPAPPPVLEGSYKAAIEPSRVLRPGEEAEILRPQRPGQ